MGYNPDRLRLPNGEWLNKATSVGLLANAVEQIGDPRLYVPKIIQPEGLTDYLQGGKSAICRPYWQEWVDNFLPGAFSESIAVNKNPVDIFDQKIAYVKPEHLIYYLQQLGIYYQGNFTKKFFLQEYLGESGTDPYRVTTVETDQGVWIDWNDPSGAWADKGTCVYQVDGTIYYDYSHRYKHDPTQGLMQQIGNFHFRLAEEVERTIPGIPPFLVEWVVLNPITEPVFCPVQFRGLPVNKPPALVVDDINPQFNSGLVLVDADLGYLKEISGTVILPERFDKLVADNKPYFLYFCNQSGDTVFSYPLNYRNIQSIGGTGIQRGALAHGFFRAIQVVWAHQGTVYLKLEKGD